MPALGLNKKTYSFHVWKKHDRCMIFTRELNANTTLDHHLYADWEVQMGFHPYLHHSDSVVAIFCILG